MNKFAFASLVQTQVETLQKEKEELQREVDELKAQNMLMYNSIEEDTVAWEDECEGGNGNRWLLGQTKKQCLAQVQHDAIIEAANFVAQIDHKGEKRAYVCDLEFIASSLLTQAQENKV